MTFANLSVKWNVSCAESESFSQNWNKIYFLDAIAILLVVAAVTGQELEEDQIISEDEAVQSAQFNPMMGGMGMNPMMYSRNQFPVDYSKCHLCYLKCL